ncbi:DDE-type integrase/transposase/recombinase [Flavobacterium salmonis]
MKKRKGRVEASWRLDETSIKVKSIWCYLYRSVDKLGNTIDFLLTGKSQRMSAQQYRCFIFRYHPFIFSL